jgi:hypothetical protein
MNGHPDDDLHVAACIDCQTRLGAAALDVNLERVWLHVAAEVWARPVGRIERLAAALLRSPGLARALVTTPSLVLSWVLATAAALGIGATLTQAGGTPWVALLAPALAGASIAYAYGPGVDPAFELSRTMAISDRMILLARGLAVFGLNAALGLIASAFAGEFSPITFAWLVPMTAVCALALAAATLAGSANVGVGAALSGWAIMVLGAAARTHDLAAAVTLQALTPLYFGITIVCIGLTLYTTGGGRNERPIWP